MPAITITAAKGLVQKTATSALPAGTLSGNLRKVITLTDADSELTAADSGAIVVCAALTGARTVTLPATAGAHFEVHVVDTGANLNFEAGTLEIVGTVVDGGAEVTSADATKSIFRVADDGAPGDRFLLTCDGTRYVVAGASVKDATKYSFQT